MYLFSALFLLLISYPPYSHCVILAATDPQFRQDMERSMAKIIRNYVELERNKLELLLQEATRLEQRSQMDGESEYNPICMYRSVEGLMKEWHELYETMNSTSLPVVLSSNATIPKLQHRSEIATAIFRMQDVYQFSAADVASGSVKGLDNTGTLTARDCYNLAGVAFSTNDHYHALMWYNEARARTKQENPTSIDEEEIIPMLALCMAKKGNRERALRLALEFDIEASESIFWSMTHSYPDLKALVNDAKTSLKEITEFPPLKNDRLDWYDTTEQPKYEALCRHEYRQESALFISNHTCYLDRRIPYFLLAPPKVESLRADPPIMIYRQIITDEEISIIKSLLGGKMARSKVSLQAMGESLPYSIRESLTGWLNDTTHPVVARVRKRVGLFSGLSMESAEDLQVTEYGIGGFYGPHYDYSSKASRTKPNYIGSYNNETGDRIATMMFYLAEPEYGGATAFPYANLVVKPTKNDAIFWYNLRKSGEGDDKTFHAGCPVVSGSKWVANKWIKEKGQEFIRPCALREHQ